MTGLLGVSHASKEKPLIEGQYVDRCGNRSPALKLCGVR